ncbi:hypothetical protein [Streptomyces aidingensis]|nr:hypothetical protein [Streptomyces aidingensis]
MTDAGITVSWDMSTEQWMETVRVVQRAGVDAMVEFALKTMPTAKTPVRFAKFFLAAGWRGLPPASARQPSQARMPRSLPPHCGECDPDTRLRSGETPDGFRVVAPCPDCHPNREGAAA